MIELMVNKYNSGEHIAKFVIVVCSLEYSPVIQLLTLVFLFLLLICFEHPQVRFRLFLDNLLLWLFFFLLWLLCFIG